MSVTITQNKRYLVVIDSESVEASINFLKPFHVYKQQADKIAIHDSTQIKIYQYSDVVTPGSTSREDLIAQLIEYNNNDHITDSVNNLTVVAEEINVSVIGVEERIGNKDEVPAPTDTSTSGLNGLFKRMLQRITEWLSGQEDANNTLIDIMNNQVDGDQKTQLVNSLNEEIGTPAKPIYVNVVNQVDLTAITNLLTDIKSFAQSIDENTDALEAKLDTINTSISNGFSVNHSDLLSVINELQGIDANTDGIELQLASLITNTNGLALETTLAAIKAQTDKLTFIVDELKVTGSLSFTDGTVANQSFTTVSVTNVATLLKAANVNRKMLTLFNDSGAVVYIKFVNTVTTASFSFRLANNEYWEMPKPIWIGDIYAIRSAGAGNVHVTEFTT